MEKKYIKSYKVVNQKYIGENINFGYPFKLNTKGYKEKDI